MMSVRSAILVVLLSAAVSQGAELRLLTGTPVSGELVSISDKEIVFKAADGKSVTTPVAQVLMVDIALPPKEPKEAKTYIDVELNDGSLLHCGKFSIKGKEVTAVLLSGQELKFPLAILKSVLNEAQDAALRKDWQERFLTKKTNRDRLVILKDKVLNGISVTFGDADEKGETIEITLAAGKKMQPFSSIHGMIFQREADPTAAPLLCKAYDINANVVYASALTVSGDKVNATTPTGVKIELPRAALARLDYTKGKLSYLSDWDPKDPKKMRVSESDALGFIDHFRRDKNLDDGPIKVDGTPYAKGLAIHSRTDLIFELDGEYREFKAIIGVDDLVNGSAAPTLVIIEDVSGANAKELHKPFEISRKNKPEDVTINVQNVKSLRISVRSPELLDLGHHVDLAEARVTK